MTLCQIPKYCSVLQTFRIQILTLFALQIINSFAINFLFQYLLLFIMPPKSDKIQSNPEKHAELNENWANNLPLIYDDHACIDRDEIDFVAQ
jgi:hypothetical protein